MIGVFNTEATTTPAVNKIPKADGSGKLDAGWLTGAAWYYVQDTRPSPDPHANAIAFWRSQAASQIYLWVGFDWVTIA